MTDHAVRVWTIAVVLTLALVCYACVFLAWSRWFGRNTRCNTPASCSTQGRPAPRRR